MKEYKISFEVPSSLTMESIIAGLDVIVDCIEFLVKIDKFVRPITLEAMKDIVKGMKIRSIEIAKEK